MAQVKLGGSTRIQLEDGRGRVLAAVGLSWNPAGFALLLENKSRCVFTSSAELKIPNDATVVTRNDWRALTSQKHPAPGSANEFSTTIPLRKDAALLELRPSDPRDGATLTDCRMAQSGAPKSPFEGEWVISTEGGPRPWKQSLKWQRNNAHGNREAGRRRYRSDLFRESRRQQNLFQFCRSDQADTLPYLARSRAMSFRLELAWAPGEYGSPFSAKRK
jgi:hypothetical protein